MTHGRGPIYNSRAQNSGKSVDIKKQNWNYQTGKVCVDDKVMQIVFSMKP